MTNLNPADIDSVTLLRADSGRRATKLWTATTIESYDAGWKFTPSAVKVNSIRNLSKLLTKIETDPRTFIIRGQVKPYDELVGVAPQGKDRPIAAGNGQINRWLEAVNDAPLHYMLIDVDGYRPDGIDPVQDPEAAVLQYIDKVLPPEFQGISCHWQLSSSAGNPGAVGILKAHVWFWSKTPYNSAQMYEWAKTFSHKIDKAPMQPVQVHYTASPLFDEGVVDPVPIRSGLYEGWLDDSVDLVIDDVLLLRAEEAAQRQSTGRDLADPKLKQSAIGTFHRVRSMDDLLDNELAEHFERGSQGHRLTWTGGNSPEGAFITDDEEHIVITNNTSPLEGPVNKFDLVRHFVFGHLDDGVDPFELLDMTGRPSFRAAMQYLEGLPEVQAEMRVGRAFRVEGYRTRVNACADAYELEQDICLSISNDRALIGSERIQLEKIVQDKAHSLLGTKPSISVVRGWLAPAVGNGGWVETNEDGQPLLTIANLEVVLRRLNATVRYNVMTKEDEILIPGHSFSVANQANAAFAHIVSACASVGLQGSATIKQYLLAIADANLYNPVMTWITGKPWDGVSRLQDFYNTLEVAPGHTRLRDLMLRKWILSAVTAIASPGGIMARGILVLAGKQYAGKSRWFRALAQPGMVRDGLLLDPSNKDSVKLAISAWLVELAEIDATFKKADINALKAFVGVERDSFRRPYAVAESTYPRQTVYGGTVNDMKYLKDMTGNTRYWTIHSLKVRHDHGIDMQQLWAEVYETMYLLAEPHWMSPAEMVEIENHNKDYTEMCSIEEIMLTELDWDAPKDKWRRVTATELVRELRLDGERNAAVRVGKVASKLEAQQITTRGVGRWVLPGRVPVEFI